MACFASLSKATSINLLTAFTILLIATLLASLDHVELFFRFSSKAGNNNSSETSSELIPIVEAVGPESFAFDRNRDGPYTGVSDGRIIKWHGNESRWTDFAVTSPERDGCEGINDHTSVEHICGRPLGLCFNEKTGDLYIADAYMGLLFVGPTGGLATQVAHQAHGVPFRFTNSLDIDQRNGVLYFTDSSARYHRRNYVSVIVSGDNSGRLMKFDPKSQEVKVLLNNLKFPNGVALSQNGDFILVAETTTCRILKLWLEPSSKAGHVEVFAQLEGFPDNIKRNSKGEFWVGINSRRGKVLEWVVKKPWLGDALVKLLPFDLTKIYTYLSCFSGYGMGVKISGGGEILEILVGKNGRRWKYVSEVEEENGNLWIGSVRMPFAVKEKIYS